MTELYTVLDDDRGTVVFEFWRGLVALHVRFKKRIAGMRMARTMFHPVLGILRSLGYKSVYVLIPEGDDKLYRFEQHFGFNEVKRVNRHILMKREV